MRGLYSATYLNAVAHHYAKTRSLRDLDLGLAFDLITGTSTGGILACALAAGIPLSKVAELYAQHGPAIFPEKVPSTLLKLVFQFRKRPRINAAGAAALKCAVSQVLGDETVGQLYERRGIALAIPAVQMAHHLAWVFKTAHLPNSKHRDDDFSLVDVCLATSAAPVFRSLAWIPNQSGPGGLAFVDGGLWANNPVLVGLIDALELTRAGDRIEIYCLGTCPPPSGDQVPKGAVDWGYGEWKFGANVPNVGISAQQYAYDNMARMLAKHTGRDTHIVRFPHTSAPPSILEHLDLDETSDAAMQALISQAQADASHTLSKTGDAGSSDGRLIDNLMRIMPEREM